MLNKLDYYLKSKRNVRSTYSGHMGRAKIILNVKEKWERDEAEKWVYQRAEDVFVDDIGVGRGVCDWLREKGLMVNGISVGEKPLDEDTRERFYNQKAQYYYSAASWIKASGKLVDNDGWLQLTWIKYNGTST